MSTLQKIAWISPEEYLEGEKIAEVKHEYVAGQVYAMVGASRSHNLVGGNLFSALHVHLKGTPCQVFIADMKVRTADAFYYPDVVVGCDKRETQAYYCEYPLLIVEVASPSTQLRDELDKRAAYQALPSLEEYVLAAQDRREVRIYRRLADGWELETCTEGDTVKLRSVELELSLTDVYDKVPPA